MGTTKPRVEDHMPLMDRSERRLTSISSFLTQAGKLQLVNSVLSSLPTYAMCSLKIPVAIMDFLDGGQRHCLWRGSDANANGKSLTAWLQVTKPKDKGGLGVVDLRSQNEVLLLKHLDKLYNKKRFTLSEHDMALPLLTRSHPSCFYSKGPSGERISSIYVPNLEELPAAKWVMVLLRYSGWMFGMISFSKRNCEGYSASQKIKRSQLLTSFQQQI